MKERVYELGSQEHSIEINSRHIFTKECTKM